MIDWERVCALREEVGPEDFDEVVELFLEEVDEEIDNLNTHQDQKQMAEKLHFLKGSALSLGFREFSALCQVGETQLFENPDSHFDIPALVSSYQASRSVFVADLSSKISA